MIMKQCHRCGAFVEYPATLCSKCQGPDQQEKKESRKLGARRYNQQRDKKYLQFYRSVQWRTLSQTYMQQAGYTCECCGAIAAEVHHKIPIQTKIGWDLRLDWSNLEAVCVTCHNKRHKRFGAR